MNSCSTPQSSGFVKVEGNTFMLEGKPYHFVGVNFWQGAYLGAGVIKGSRARLVRELDLMKKYGITNLRVMASSEKCDIKNAVGPAFQVGPGEFNEMLMLGMDFLLDEMSKRNIKAIMVLNNYWEWSGGMSQYINWATGRENIDPTASGEWWEFMKMSGEFYGIRQANEIFLNYVRFITQRKNSVNNKIYANDPTIMTWELANEPRPHPEAKEKKELLKEYYNWVDSVSKFLHILAPKQLVTTGTEGTHGCLEDSAIFIDSHKFKNIDYATFHLWPKNWDWFKAEKGNETIPLVLENATKYFNKHMELAHVLNKPIVLEEYGLGRDYEKYTIESPVDARDTFLSHMFGLIEKAISNNQNITGCNIWTWGGEGRPHNPEAKWIPGTDFTGDPPQEPQGLNSIFDTDTSTLKLIKQHAKNLSVAPN